MSEWTPEAIAAEEERRAADVRRGFCPDGGGRLTRNGEAGPDSLSCGVCDCFGYPPVVRIETQP